MSKFSGDQGYQAFRLLQVAFVVAPIVAGLDKFFYLLTDWSQYIAPFTLRMLGGHDRGFMMLVGLVEMIAGIGVFFKPQILATWLRYGCSIIFNLLLTGQYFDIALRDVGLMLAAFALARLSQKYAQ